MDLLIPFTFEDSNGTLVEISVTPEVFEVLDEERKEVERRRKEHERRGSDYDVEDEYVMMEHWKTQHSLEDDVHSRLEMDRLLEFLDENCSKKQQARFYLNRILGYSFAKIAQNQGCTEGAVRHSVNLVSKKIKHFLK